MGLGDGVSRRTVCHHRPRFPRLRRYREGPRHAERSARAPQPQKISPKTLSALIEKEDLEIPLIETLELIPEPDGSVTDDFVIPEWLNERQKRQRAAQQDQ